MKSVLQDWLFNLSWMQQTVVITAIRGCDGTRKNDPTKGIVRELRKTILHDAGGEGSSYMNVNNLTNDMQNFYEDIDSYPLHFVTHLIHSAEIIGYKHPDEQVRLLWGGFYEDVCHTIHLNPETEIQLDDRLKDNRDESIHGNKYKTIKNWWSTYINKKEQLIKQELKSKSEPVVYETGRNGS